MKRRTMMLMTLVSAWALMSLTRSVPLAAAEPPLEPIIQVCAAADGLMRIVALGTTCPAGQRGLKLQRAEANLEPPKTDDDTKPTCTPADTKRIAELERRLKELEDGAEGGSVTQRVVAPFVVNDKDGNKVFSVEHDDWGNRAYLFSPGGKKSARMVASENGGYFLGTSIDQKFGAAVGAGGSAANLAVVDHVGTDAEVSRVILGKNLRDGLYGLTVQKDASKPIAFLGERQDGNGHTRLYDSAGKPRVGMGVLTKTGKGGIGVQNDAGTLVGVLTEGTNGGGLMYLTNQQEQMMVEAGVTAEQVGVVRAGPESFKPGYGVLGLPGSYISGKPK
ncbi:MAG: hypothetical protein U1F35_13420 [Steroidobacteraceae bacterium]